MQNAILQLFAWHSHRPPAPDVGLWFDSLFLIIRFFLVFEQDPCFAPWFTAKCFKLEGPSFGHYPLWASKLVPRSACLSCRRRDKWLAALSPGGGHQPRLRHVAGDLGLREYPFSGRGRRGALLLAVAGLHDARWLAPPHRFEAHPVRPPQARQGPLQLPARRRSHQNGGPKPYSTRKGCRKHFSMSRQRQQYVSATQ